MPFPIAHSPDSDDAYMMAPLALGWLDPEGFDCRFVRKDIETLNGEALEGRYDVTAISFGAYPELLDRYQLLTAGSSIQEGTGPLVVSGRPMAKADLAGVTVAIPGLRTSAYLAMKKWQPGLQVELVPFDQIMDAVAGGRFQAGLLIHESQLMYRDAGLHLVADLGAWWKEDCGLPLPMGGTRRAWPIPSPSAGAWIRRWSAATSGPGSTRSPWTRVPGGGRPWTGCWDSKPIGSKADLRPAPLFFHRLLEINSPRVGLIV